MMTEKPDDEDVAAAARRFMTEEYQRFPTLAGAQRALRQVVTLLADGTTGDHTLLRGQGPHRLHRRDRARGRRHRPRRHPRRLPTQQPGRPAVAGTDHGIHPRPHRTPTRSLTFAEARLTDEVLGVREEYLDAARRTIDENFGDLTGYLEAVGVTDDDLAKLRAFLLG